MGHPMGHPLLVLVASYEGPIPKVNNKETHLWDVEGTCTSLVGHQQDSGEEPRGLAQPMRGHASDSGCKGVGPFQPGTFSLVLLLLGAGEAHRRRRCCG